MLLYTCGNARAKPFLVVSTRNFDAMITGMTKIGEAFEPGSTKNLKQNLLREIGHPEMIGVDRSRPWHHATFRKVDGSSRPSSWNAIYIPVSDFNAFTNASPDGDGFKGWHNAKIVRRSGDYAVLIQQSDRHQLAEADEERIVEWAKTAPSAMKHDISVVFELDDPTRNLAAIGVAIARSMLAQQMKPVARRREPAPTALLPPGAYQMLTTCLDLGSVIVRGTKRVTITLDVEEDRLLLRDRVEAVPDSQFARLLQPSASDLDSLMPFFDADTPVVVAAHIVGDSYLRKLFLKAVQTGNKPDETFTKETEELIDAMLPMSVATGLDWRRNYRAAGIYQFAGSQASALQGRFLKFIQGYLASQNGDERVYAGIKVRRNVRQVDSMQIDQLQAKLDPDSPIFAAEGPKEALARIWPNNEINAEFASQGARLFYSSGTPVEQTVRPARNPLQPAVKADTNTVMLVRFNPVELMIHGLVNQRRPTRRTLKLLELLEADDAAIDAKVNLDGGMSGTVSVPFNLIREFGKYVNAMKSRSKPE